MEELLQLLTGKLLLLLLLLLLRLLPLPLLLTGKRMPYYTVLYSVPQPTAEVRRAIELLAGNTYSFAGPFPEDSSD